MNKNIVYPVGKYTLFFILLYLLQSANIQGLHPFAFGMLFALVWCNQKIYILAPLYVLSGFLVFFSLENFIVSLITVVVFGLAYFMHYKFKRPLNLVLIGLYAFLSQFGMLYYATMEPTKLWNGIVTLVLSMVAMYSYLHILQNVVLRGLRRKFMIDEIISAGVLFFALGSGLYSMPYGEYIYFGILTFVLLCVCFAFGTTSTLMLATILGLGASFSAEQFLLVSHAIVLAITVCATKCSKRVLSGISIILVDIIVGLYFMPNYDLYHLLATVLGALIFVLIPNKILNSFVSFVITEKEDVAVRTIINRSRKTLCERLYELSEVFFNMKNVFNGMVKGVKSFDEASVYLAEQVKLKICSACNNSNECLRMQSKETTNAIIEMLYFAFERGKVSLLDVPPNLCAHCKKLNVLINTVNSVIDEYKSNLQSNNNLDSGRLLLGEQMWGVSQIMRSLAVEVSLNVSFDTTMEKRIVEELMYANIVCSEAVVYRKQEKICSVTLVVRKKNLNEKNLIKVVDKCLGIPMEISSITNGEKAGFSVFSLNNANKYDIIFGSAGATKSDSKKSGDTHTVMKLSNNKILLALCDGMGSGEQAEKISSLALGLIENFYKAGFENSLILSSVNKLLSMSGEETFSALDASVIDLNDGTCDMIKLGSPVTYLKTQQGIKKIDAGALPLGILEELKPNIRSFTLNDNDMIIFMTDGIADSFSCLDDLENLIIETETSNPQILANAILDKALYNNKNLPQDDMTVLVGRILCKY